MKIRYLVLLLFLPAVLMLNGCVKQGPSPHTSLSPEKAANKLAEEYVRLSLEIGTHEPGYIDAYYGPAEWKTQAESNPRALPELAMAVDGLDSRLASIQAQLAGDESIGSDDMLVRRIRFLRAQLNAARTRIRMLRGEKLSFREESLGLFGATPDLVELETLDPLIDELDKLVPGKGELIERMGNFRKRYVIKTEHLKPVFDAAIAACRARTMAHINLPQDEHFTMEFVTDKNWSGYNYYQGNFHSLIQINTDLPIMISRAVDLGCHEGYPGHHVLNMLLEKNLTRNLGWVEFSVYPLYSPQSLIAEGSANYGIELSFPGEQRLQFERDTLYPLAGLDPASASEFTQFSHLLDQLSRARFTIAQKYLDGEISRDQAIALTQKYLLVAEKNARQSIGFTDQYRSYVINYGLGRDMVRDYVEHAGDDPAFRWAAMEKILSEPTLPADLVVQP